VFNYVLMSSLLAARVESPFG